MVTNRNILWARAIAQELARSGVRAAAIAPGSRSGPLAIALDAEPAVEVTVHADERSAAFFALGHARASGRPVAVLTTSGTAVANLLPAVAEAHLQRTPLVLLTADRPPELRGCGARQTIDQPGIFGSHVRAAVELPVPEPTDGLLRAARATVCRMVDAATGASPGPVQINVPLREPLDAREVAGDVPDGLDPVARDGRPDGAPFVAFERAVATPRAGTVEALCAAFRAAPRGLIVAGQARGPREHALAVAGLARATGYPVLADPSCALRTAPPEGVTVISAHDAILRAGAFAAAHAPELIVRIGAPPVSKATSAFIAGAHDAVHVLLDPGAGLDDPEQTGPRVVRAEPDAVAAAVAERLGAPPADPAWVAAWTDADARARAALDRAAEADGGSLPSGLAEWFEAGLVRRLHAAMPEGALLFSGNSMPIRELDAFLPARGPAVRVLSNHGANGIDGVVSSALGAVAATGAPGVLLIGDLSLLHDAGGLLAARRYAIPLTIVVIDNDGGGIFGYLPAAENAERFEALFTTPHGADLSGLAATFGLPFARAEDAASFERAVRSAIGSGGPSIVLAPMDREKSLARHRAAWAATREALA